MKRTLTHALLLLPLAAGGLAGCNPPPSKTAESSPRAPAQLPVKVEVPEERRVSATAIGPLHVGMTEKEIRGLTNYQISSHTLQLEGEKTPALILRQFGLNVALAELKDGRAWRIRALGENCATPEGAHAGQRAKDLERIYGPGKVLSGEGNVALTFEKAPGLSFMVEPPSARKLATADWEKVAKANPRISMILLVGGD